MNLLTDQWIPVRLLDGGTPQKISLRELLCGEEKWELCLPRDDMELAAMQLLVCITQALFTPKDGKELLSRIARSITVEEYEATAARYDDWFRMDHPQWPFMQVKGVVGKDTFSVEELFAGLTRATNSCFVNEPNLAAKLCPGCTAIALFNQATCAPGFGGGFKDPLRGGTPVTTLVQGPHLQQTIWLNVLSDKEVNRHIPWHLATINQKPTWIEPIKSGSVAAQSISLVRGLFWQPAHIELLSPVAGSINCSCCGSGAELYFEKFGRAKFSSYSVEGTWPHPHSARNLIINSKSIKSRKFRENLLEERFVSFSSNAPAWTQLNRFVDQMFPRAENNGYEPAAVILQSRDRNLFGSHAGKLIIAIGGYQRKKASVVGRCHEVCTINSGWSRHTEVIRQLVTFGLDYKNALVNPLIKFSNGLKNTKTKKVIAKGLGQKFQVYDVAKFQFFRATDITIQNTLANINFEEPGPAFIELGRELEKTCKLLFDDAVGPYRNDPELIRTIAITRNYLNHNLVALRPQSGGIHGKIQAP